jgi:hypothetical protein
MTVLYMAFIISWKVLGELHKLKNITSGAKNPNLVLNAWWRSTASEVRHGKRNRLGAAASSHGGTVTACDSYVSYTVNDSSLNKHNYQLGSPLRAIDWFLRFVTTCSSSMSPTTEIAWNCECSPTSSTFAVPSHNAKCSRRPYIRQNPQDPGMMSRQRRTNVPLYVDAVDSTKVLRHVVITVATRRGLRTRLTPRRTCAEPSWNKLDRGRDLE